MKSFLLVALSSLFLLSCATTSTSKYKLRPYQEVTLKNGLRVLLIEDHSLPYFSAMTFVKAGASSDPEGRAGLSSLVADLLNKGSKKRNASELADSLGQMGASFESGVTRDYSWVSIQGLAKDQDQLLKDYFEMLTEPAFSKKEIAREKRKLLSQLKKTADDPKSVASIAYSSFIYGDHPYANRVVGRPGSVRKIKKKDIILYYLNHYRPNNSITAIIGDFDSKKMVQRLETQLAKWTPRKQKNLVFPSLPQFKGMQIQLVDKSDLKQTQIRMGHKGIKRSNPDFLKLRVANHILGGAFSSRLMNKIRKDRGLTYSIGSWFGYNQDYGAFTISTFTRHEKVGEVIGETLGILKEFRANGVTQQEVKESIAMLKGGFPRALETPEKLAQNLLILRFYGIGDDYLTNYLSDIEKVTVSDVNGAIKKYFDVENMKVIVFSPKSKTYDQVKKLGELKVRSYKEIL